MGVTNTTISGYKSQPIVFQLGLLQGTRFPLGSLSPHAFDRENFLEFSNTHIFLSQNGKMQLESEDTMKFSGLKLFFEI